MNDINKNVSGPIYELRRIAQTILRLESRGFKESYSSAQLEKLIYDSHWCRISMIWSGWDSRNGNSIYIVYGRHHAPSEETTMLYNGEVCNCWHDVDLALHFLDRQQPADIVKQYYSHPVTAPFYTDEIKQKYPHRQAEWLAEMHVTIWNHYGQRFFELFDLRRSALWEQYRQFLKEFYDIKGRYGDIFPPLDKVC